LGREEPTRTQKELGRHKINGRRQNKRGKVLDHEKNDGCGKYMKRRTEAKVGAFGLASPAFTLRFHSQLEGGQTVKKTARAQEKKGWEGKSLKKECGKEYPYGPTK